MMNFQLYGFLPANCDSFCHLSLAAT